MKENILKIVKIVIIFFLSVVILYLILTLNRFLFWCNRNQIILFNTNIHSDYIIDNVDRDVIDSLGSNIEDYEKALEESKSNLESFKGDGNFTFTKDGQIHSFAEFYDPLGFSVWSYLSSEFQSISTLYIDIAILWGVIITVFYVIITSPKINHNFKFTIGYFGIMIFIIQMYGYITGKYRNFIDSFKHMPLFFIFYTIIFLAIFFINRKKYKKIVKGLNKSILDKEN